MGFFQKIKQLFNKNIECGAELNDKMVFYLKKNKFLYFNKNIFVREKCACVIVYKCRVCDILFQGKYRINEESIPEVYSRSKIEKLKGKGGRSRKIRTDIYYVNLDTFRHFKYSSDTPFKVKSNELGRIKGFLEGFCAVKVLDPGALLRALIVDTGKAKTHEVHKDVGLWIGNKINYLIKKHKIPTDLVLNNYEYVESVINADMQDALDKIGLFVTDVKLKSINFPKRYQLKINEYLSKQNRPLKRFDLNTAKNPVWVVSKSQGNATLSDSKISLNYGTMQKVQNSTKSTTFLKCNRCGKQLNTGVKICTGCGNKLN